MGKKNKFINYIFNKEQEEDNNMNKNNIKFLSEFEADFITALFYDYTRMIPQSKLMEIDRIYAEESGQNLNTNYNCSNCILKLLKQTGKMYFKQNPDKIPEDLKERFEKYNK